MKELHRVHDWDQHQHYKDRCPPWIKYHSDLLVNRKYVSLPLKRRAILDNLWLVASRSNGIVDLSLEEVRFQIHSSQVNQSDIDSLLGNGFFDPILADASTLLADATRKREGEERERDIREREREREREGRRAVNLVEKTQLEENTCSEPSAAEPPFIQLPTNKNGEEYPVSQKQLTEWADCYPAVDVSIELKKMRGWLLANKTRRKTRTGMPRFIANWLGKAQDQARASPAIAKTREQRVRELEALRHDSK